MQKDSLRALLREREEVFMPVVLDADRIDRSLTRIAHEIAERNEVSSEVVLIGIQRPGVPLARRLASESDLMWVHPLAQPLRVVGQ